MTPDERTSRLEQIVIDHDERMSQLETIAREIKLTLASHTALLNDIMGQLVQQNDRLGRIEQILRERPYNGSRP